MIVINEKDDMIRVAAFFVIMLVSCSLYGSEEKDPLSDLLSGKCDDPIELLTLHGKELASRVKQGIIQVDMSFGPESAIAEFELLRGINGSFMESCGEISVYAQIPEQQAQIAAVEKKLQYNNDFLNVLIRRMGEKIDRGVH